MGRCFPWAAAGRSSSARSRSCPAGPATATVTTAEPTRALVIGAPEFRALLDQQPSIQRRVLHSFSERLAPHVI